MSETETPWYLHEIIRTALGTPGRLAGAISLPSGTVNEVWRLEIAEVGDAILRIAPSDVAAASGPSWLTSFGLRREQGVIALLPDLAAILPGTIHADFSRTILDRDWAIQRLVPGRPWSEVDAELTQEQQLDLWRQSGTICRAIHGVRRGEFGGVAGPETGLRSRSWAGVLLADGRGFIDDAARFGLDAAPFIALRDAIARHRETLDLVTTASLIHSDLGPRHLFVEPDDRGDWKIVGLIDLEFGRFADPMSESQIEVFDLIPPDPVFQEAFWQGYGAVDHPPGREIRSLVYQAIVLGWVVTDFARLDRPGEIPSVLVELATRLADL
ncbi:MAG TPA: aminoglycoside phosphotransferase family protein [Thermomicrobiales bacterium]|nr:aminoglycoside phosphotransferase family protein [Thermomicrobiales bacterium]